MDFHQRRAFVVAVVAVVCVVQVVVQLVAAPLVVQVVVQSVAAPLVAQSVEVSAMLGVAALVQDPGRAGIDVPRV